MHSKNWIREHIEDPFVKRATREGWRSRAVYKLQELDGKYGLIKPGMTIVDLGAAPGSWSQYAAKKVGKKGKVIAIDVLDMDTIDNVFYLQGDFSNDQIYKSLMDLIGQKKVDLVLCDMAPNITGISSVDQPGAMYLAELAADFAKETLVPKGSLIVKLFHGSGFDDYVKMLRKSFYKVLIRKPEASRPRSREVYALATQYKV